MFGSNFRTLTVNFVSDLFFNQADKTSKNRQDPPPPPPQPPLRKPPSSSTERSVDQIVFQTSIVSALHNAVHHLEMRFTMKTCASFATSVLNNCYFQHFVCFELQTVFSSSFSRLLVEASLRKKEKKTWHCCWKCWFRQGHQMKVRTRHFHCSVVYTCLLVKTALSVIRQPQRCQNDVVN